MFEERENDWLMGQLTAAVEAVAREVLERPADDELDLAEAHDRLAEDLERFWRELPLPELLSRLDADATVALLRPSPRVLAYVLSVALKAQLDAWQGRTFEARCGIERSEALFDAWSRLRLTPLEREAGEQKRREIARIASQIECEDVDEPQIEGKRR